MNRKILVAERRHESTQKLKRNQLNWTLTQESPYKIDGLNLPFWISVEFMVINILFHYFVGSTSPFDIRFRLN